MSFHQQIAEAVRDQIGTITGIPRMVIRSQAFRLKSDPVSLVVITRGIEQQGPYMFGGSQFREYEIAVTILSEQGMELESGIDSAKSLRQIIKQTLVPAHDSPNTPLPKLPGVWDVDAVEFPIEDEDKTKGGYETAMLGLVYRSNENYRGAL